MHTLIAHADPMVGMTMQARRRIPWRIASVLILVVALGAAMAVPPAPAAADASMLGLATQDFPAGARVVTSRLDTTAAAVNAEGIFSPDTQGVLYAKLRFAGTLVQIVQLPRFARADRGVILMATLFPSAAAAGAAFASDRLINGCAGTPAISIPARAATCAYVLPKSPEAGIYVIATSGTVEYLVQAYVSNASAAAARQATEDGVAVARQEADHISHLAALGALHIYPSPLLHTVRAGGSPRDAAVDTSTGRLILTDDSPSGLTILDALTGHLMRTVRMSDVGVAITLDTGIGHLFLIGVNFGSSVVMLDSRSGAVLHTTSLEGAALQAASVDERTHHLFALDTLSDSVYMLSTRTGAVLHQTAVGRFPDAIAIDGPAGHAFIANRDSNSVTMLDTQTGAALHTVATGKEPMFIIADAAASRVFVVNANALGSPAKITISMLDGHTGALIRTVAAPGASQLAVDERAGHVFVVDNSDTTAAGGLTMFDARTATALQTITLGIGPSSIAVDARHGRAFVVNTGSSTISMIDTRTGVVQGTYAEGKKPGGVIVDPITARAFVLGGTTISVLNTAVGE